MVLKIFHGYRRQGAIVYAAVALSVCLSLMFTRVIAHLLNRWRILRLVISAWHHDFRSKREWRLSMGDRAIFEQRDRDKDAILTSE